MQISITKFRENTYYFPFQHCFFYLTKSTRCPAVGHDNIRIPDERQLGRGADPLRHPRPHAVQHALPVVGKVLVEADDEDVDAGQDAAPRLVRLTPLCGAKWSRCSYS